MKYGITTVCALTLLAAPMTTSASLDNITGAKAGTAHATRSTAKHVLVDINSASKHELMKVLGLTDPEAEAVVAGRPYGSKAFLVTRKILTTGVYLDIRARIVARQPR